MKRSKQLVRRLAYIMCLGVFVVGCTPEEELTITEQRRLTANPKAVAFLMDAQRAFERGAFNAALGLSDSAEVYEPDLADIHFLRGRVYTELNQLDIAELAYEAALEADPAYQGAHMNLAVNLLRRGKMRGAIDRFFQEEERYPTTGLYLELGRTFAKLGEPDSALWAYEQAIAVDDSNATAYMWMGQLYEEIGEMEKALETSRRGMRLRPENLDYRYIIGTQLYRTGELEEAASFLQTVAEARPWHHGAQYNYGQVLMRQGEETEAQHYLVRADSAQQLQQRINEAQNAINREPENLEYWERLAKELVQGGMVDRAIEAYKVAITIEPWNLYLQSNLANLILQSGDTVGATRRYRAILGIDSTLADVWLNLGVAYANGGQRSQAEQAWKRTLSLQPRHPTAQAYLARLDEIKPAD